MIEVCFRELMGKNACQNDKVADTLSGVRVEKQVQNMKAIEPIVKWVLLPNVLSVSSETEFT